MGVDTALEGVPEHEANYLGYGRLQPHVQCIASYVMIAGDLLLWSRPGSEI